jgi:hypothetical protein
MVRFAGNGRKESVDLKSSNLYSSDDVSGGVGQPLSRPGTDKFLSSRAAINDGQLPNPVRRAYLTFSTSDRPL